MPVTGDSPPICTTNGGDSGSPSILMESRLVRGQKSGAGAFPDVAADVAPAVVRFCEWRDSQEIGLPMSSGR